MYIYLVWDDYIERDVIKVQLWFSGIFVNGFWSYFCKLFSKRTVIILYITFRVLTCKFFLHIWNFSILGLWLLKFLFFKYFESIPLFIYYQLPTYNHQYMIWNYYRRANQTLLLSEEWNINRSPFMFENTELVLICYL